MTVASCRNNPTGSEKACGDGRNGARPLAPGLPERRAEGAPEGALCRHTFRWSGKSPLRTASGLRRSPSRAARSPHTTLSKRSLRWAGPFGAAFGSGLPRLLKPCSPSGLVPRAHRLARFGVEEPTSQTQSLKERFRFSATCLTPGIGLGPGSLRSGFGSLDAQSRRSE
jgi:hypothetical protein